ncbi:unnamed protein product, partial [Didymodactylos carnosus]
RLFICLLLWFLFAFLHLKYYRYTWYYKYRTNETELHTQMKSQLKLAQIFWDKLIEKYSRNDTYYKRKSNIKFDICTVLITSPRLEHPTLHQTIASLVSSMNEVDRQTREIIVYNTARPSSIHKYAQQLSNTHIPYFNVFNYSQLNSTLIEKWYSNKNTLHLSEHDEWIRTENLDYLTSLFICNSQYKYVLILQDDLIFRQNFFTHLTLGLNSLKNTNNCAWIKLFVSDFWDGWEDKDLNKVIGISMFLAFIIMLIDQRKKLRNSHC